MSAENDIRSALRSEADRYDPADDGWAGITSGVRAARRRRRLQGGALGGLAAAGIALAIGLSVTADSGTDVDAGRDPGAVATEPEESGTTTPAPTTTEPQATNDAGFPGIWPFASEGAVANHEDGDGRFEDPAATAEAFARDYVGMLDPVVGDPEPVGEGAVAVELRPRGEDGQPVPDGGPSSVVYLLPYETSYGARVWTVSRASSPNLVLDEPFSFDEVRDVVEVRGRGTGYEGNVRAEVRQDGMQVGSNLGETIGITGSNGELGPLSLDVDFRTPTEPGGAVLVTTDTGLDGVGVPEFTVVRLHFAEVGERPPAADVPATDCRARGATEGEPAADEMDVTVYFICSAAVAAGDPVGDATFVPVSRRLPRDAAVLGATLRSFLAGTSAEGNEAGLFSFTHDPGADVIVTLDGGTAVVDFGATVTSDANSASTSAGSELFLGSLNRTVFQFPTVEAIEYRLDGSCDAFQEWLQRPCQPVTRDDL